MSKEQIDQAASFILYIIGALMLLGGVAVTFAGVGCGSGWFTGSFCTPEAIAGRRTFFLEALAGLAAMWAGLKIVEDKL